MSRLVWLVAYPKSGITWFRALWTNFLCDGDTPASINALDEVPFASSRALFDRAVGCQSGELSPEEIDRLRPEVHLQLGRAEDGPRFCRVHDAYTRRPDNQLRQVLLSWSEYVASWLEAPGLRVHVVRYEDLRRDPAAVFGGAMRFAGFADDPARVAKAVHFSRFEELQRQERAHGYRDRHAPAGLFSARAGPDRGGRN